ncbi:rhodanese-like domain-containing protein [Flavobacterium restrictum]|uniref:Rhodanese-like domain-containing protein n=1 Tax=Flavobacterium restrictum TaxID=2594428 RepID=A0A553DR47_9FLAO|nr:rhodanese-like domain-containing protein [Flavobacterium restrictum]TRX35227.1 rhodanese-like domain-containing protein [Flavobacterium restrictum]
MINILKKILGLGNTVNFPELLEQGALIIDVRSQNEFANGHLKGAINIPVGTLKNNLPQRNNQNKPIITCCASGMRSAAAKKILTSNGYSQVYNGGGWSSLQDKIQTRL